MIDADNLLKLIDLDILHVKNIQARLKKIHDIEEKVKVEKDALLKEIAQLATDERSGGIKKIYTDYSKVYEVINKEANNNSLNTLNVLIPSLGDILKRGEKMKELAKAYQTKKKNVENAKKTLEKGSNDKAKQALDNCDKEEKMQRKTLIDFMKQDYELERITIQKLCFMHLVNGAMKVSACTLEKLTAYMKIFRAIDEKTETENSLKAIIPAPSPSVPPTGQQNQANQGLNRTNTQTSSNREGNSASNQPNAMNSQIRPPESTIKNSQLNSNVQPNPGNSQINTTQPNSKNSLGNPGSSQLNSNIQGNPGSSQLNSNIQGNPGSSQLNSNIQGNPGSSQLNSNIQGNARTSQLNSNVQASDRNNQNSSSFPGNGENNQGNVRPRNPNESQVGGSNRQQRAQL